VNNPTNYSRMSLDISPVGLNSNDQGEDGIEFV